MSSKVRVVGGMCDVLALVLFIVRAHTFKKYVFKSLAYYKITQSHDSSCCILVVLVVGVCFGVDVVVLFLCLVVLTYFFFDGLVYTTSLPSSDLIERIVQ